MRFLRAIGNYFIPSFIGALVILIIINIIRFIIDKMNNEKYSLNKKSTISQLLLITYIIGVLCITDFFYIFEEGISNDIQMPNLIPLYYTINGFINNFSITLRLVFYNIILLLPFGFFIPLSIPNKKWNNKRIVKISLIFIIIIELLEVLSGRCFDIDDIIINCVGSIIGYYIYTCSAKIKKKK